MTRILTYLKDCTKQLLRLCIGKSISQIATQVQQYKVVSFDVFDTLIVRSCSSPRSVFDEVSKRLSCPDFKNARIEAEALVRKDYEREVTLDDIYSKLEAQGAYSSEMCKRLKETEIEVELDFCKANIPVRDLFRQLQQETRVIIISDMYLPKEVIQQILGSNGIKIDSDDLFVSSEAGITKRDGGLFKYVLDHLSEVNRSSESYAVNPSDIVHIGDHVVSDYLKPRAYNMNALLLR